MQVPAVESDIALRPTLGAKTWESLEGWHPDAKVDPVAAKRRGVAGGRSKAVDAPQKILKEEDEKEKGKEEEEEEEKLTNSCLRKQLHKTRMCTHFLKGGCQFGEDCTFAHDSGELSSAPDLRKTRLCKAFAQGSCKDPECIFAHSTQDLRFTGMFYKKTMCTWFEKGTCRNGDKCRFAHGRGELQAPPMDHEGPPAQAAPGAARWAPPVGGWGPGAPALVRDPAVPAAPPGEPMFVSPALGPLPGAAGGLLCLEALLAISPSDQEIGKLRAMQEAFGAGAADKWAGLPRGRPPAGAGPGGALRLQRDLERIGLQMAELSRQFSGMNKQVQEYMVL